MTTITKRTSQPTRTELVDSAERSRDYSENSWPTANTAARHAGLNAVVGYEIFGKALPGVPERISPMV